MQLWTPEHIKTIIPTTIVMIVVAIILRITIGKKSEQVRFIPFQIMAVALFVLEIAKQAYQISTGYDIYSLPFHFCSLFIFLPIIMAFYRGKHDQKVRAVTTMACAALFMFMMIYPDLIYGAGNILAIKTDLMSFHTVIFHNIAMFEFILIIALKLYTPNTKRDMKVLVIFFTVYCLFEAVMANILKTNFNSMYYNAIPPIENLRLAIHGAIGAFFGQTVYCLAVVVVDILFVSLGYWIFRLLLFIFSKISNLIQNRKNIKNKSE